MIINIAVKRKVIEFERMAQEAFGQNVKVEGFKIQGSKGYGYRLYEKDETGEYKIVFTVRQREFAKRLDAEWDKRFALYKEIATEMIREFNPPITFDLNPISGEPQLRLFLNMPWCTYGERGKEPELYFTNEQELRVGLAMMLTCVTMDEDIGCWEFDAKLAKK